MDVKESAQDEKRHVVQAASLLLDLAEQTGSTQLPHEIEAYFSVVIYKIYRYIYMADPAGVEAVSYTHLDVYKRPAIPRSARR